MFPEVEFESFEDGDLIYGLLATRDNYVNNFSRFSDALTQNDRLGSADYFMDFYRPYWDGRYESNTLRQNKFKTSILNNRRYNNIIKKAEKSNSNVMRKCKAGLNWAKEDNIRVHFLLEDIDMIKVVNKTGENIEKLGTVKTVTGSELRWVYRNRHDEGVQKNVQFWNRGRRVDPPWVTDSAPWDMYDRKREEKRLRAEALSVSRAKRARETEVVEERFDFFSDFLIAFL